MFKTIKNRSSRVALLWAICLLIPPILVSCKKESPTVSAADLVARATDILPGYNYPSVMEVYPTDGAPDVPRDTSYVIVFNIPVDASDFDTQITINSSSLGGLTRTTHFDITPLAGTTTVATINFIGPPYNPIPANDVVTVNIGAGIHSIGPPSVSLNNPGARTFTVGAAPDTTVPQPGIPPSPESRNPLPGAINVNRATPDIRINITEANAINPTTVNGTTFWLEDTFTGLPVPLNAPTITGAAPTWTINMWPSSALVTNRQYTVHLTAGIEDLSGNPLDVVPSPDWSFTTVYTDPVAGEPLVIYNPNCTGFNAAGTTAYVNWITNEATDCTLHYGRGNDVPLAAPVSGTFTFHGLSLGGLGAGDRYWMQLNAGDVVDITSIPNTIVYGPFEFNTPTSEAIIDVHSSGTNSQIIPNAIPNRFNVAATGVFLFYTDLDGASRKLYGQRYDNTLTPQWLAPAPHGLYTANQNFYFQSAVEDEEGGVIVIASMNSATSGLYVKRINADGSFFDWGATANDAGDNGLAIDNSGANDGMSPSAVTVYTGQIVEVAEGTVEREAFVGNLFKDDWSSSWGTINDFTDVQVNNYVLDTDSHVMRTVTAKPAVFRHMMQTNFAIPSGNNYVIADHTASEAVTVNDHYIYTTPLTPVLDRQANGTNMFYTEHYTSAFLTLGDVIYNGANGGIVTGLNTIDFVGSPYNGSLIQDSTITDFAVAAPWWIEDTTVADFSALAAIDDLVYNDTDDVSTFVIAPLLASSILNINDQASFDVAGEAYKIYRGDYCFDHLENDALNPFYQITVNWNMGLVEPNPITIYDSYNTTTATLVAENNPYPNPLFDNEANFVASGVANGDIVIDFDGRQVARVDASVYAPRRHMLRMDGEIAANGEEYGIIRFVDGVTTVGDITAVGKATGISAGHLLDATGGAFTAVSEGDVVYNHTDNQYAMVTSVNVNDLTLSRDASFGAGDRYIVFRQRGVLYIWEEGGNIYCRTMRMANGTTQLRATAAIFAGTQPRAIPDGAGNALVVYRDAGNIIRARLLNGRGATVFGPMSIDTVHANMSILRVEQDRNNVNPDRGGAMVLYTYDGGANLAVQWVRNTGGALARGNGGTWPDGGRLVVAGAVTTSDMSFNYSGGNPYAVVTYQQANKIYAGCVGQFTWSNPISTPATGTQQKPRIFLNGANTIILWEDNRFLSNVGYGIFGMKINATTGLKDAGWRANTSGADDYNGVAVILNQYNQLWPSQGGVEFSMCLMPYNDGTEAVLFWEDYRQPTENANIAGLRVDNFTP